MAPRSDGTPNPNVPRLIEVLDRHGVQYVLVGGVAANAYGAQRLTYDLDCLAARSSENLGRLATAMLELNARLRVAGLSDEESAALPGFIDGPRLARMEISTWRTDAGDFDVLADIPDRSGHHLRYEQLAPRASIVRYKGIEIRVASLDDVIASKEWADRPKDHAALPELRALRDGLSVPNAGPEDETGR